MTSAAVVDRLSTLADPTRARILYVLDKQELTVSELCTVMQLPQSTVSRHLKVLSDDGWVTSRADGTSRFYRREMGIDASGSRLWELVADDLSRTDRGREDLERIVMVLAR
ncbi:MAG: ArsR/SmtB family transcription factor, partial [Gemmatimonadaceae bacterium]